MEGEIAIPGCNTRDRQKEKHPQCSGKSQKMKRGVCIICKGGEERLVMGQREEERRLVAEFVHVNLASGLIFFLDVIQLKVASAQDSSSSFFC